MFVVGFGVFWTPCRHWLLPLQQTFWTVPFCLLAGGGSKFQPLRTRGQSAYLRLFNGRGGDNCSPEQGRCRRTCLSFVGVYVCAPGSPAALGTLGAGAVGSTAGGKSLHAAARSRLPVKFGLRDCAHLHRTLVRLCARSQVCGLFEGMLEKLELDDDGKSLIINGLIHL